jgi:transcription elongation GreA/GreB family factor
VSKAFTREDDDAGIEPMPSSRAVPRGAFRLTREGARKLANDDDPRVREALRHAEIVEITQRAPERAALGVTAEVEDDRGERHLYRLVSAEERALCGEGCSVESPMGKALLGARRGESREVVLPRGVVEVEVVGLRGTLA